MSAALQLPMIWGSSGPRRAWIESDPAEPEPNAAERQPQKEEEDGKVVGPATSLAFYRKHTESMLRRYLYASMQVGRAPSILGDPVGRGWVSSRPVRTFEDAVIFVLDVEQCLKRLSVLDRHLLSKVVLQEYTQSEAAAMLGMSLRAVAYKVPQALDRLTEKLLESGLLILPNS
jgi:hypothetical protein